MQVVQQYIILISSTSIRLSQGFPLDLCIVTHRSQRIKHVNAIGANRYFLTSNATAMTIL
jgi:hypothetical protein